MSVRVDPLDRPVVTVGARGMIASRRRAWERVSIAIPAAIGVLVGLVFSPVIDNGFVGWDDRTVIVNNLDFRGFTWPHLHWMFTTVLMGHYVPVTWLTLALDHALWGMEPSGYHLVNLLLHAANAALFYLVARRLLVAASDFPRGAVTIGAAVASLFFALHPLRAESVAWVTERRDVLSGFFFFLTVLGYLRARETDGAARRWLRGASVAAYALACLSKSMVMTLPAVLFVLDVYPFRRVAGIRGWFAPAAAPLRREKVPYVVLGLIDAILGYYAQAANSFITSLATIGWSGRVAMVAYSLWFYVAKTFLPVALSPLYELPAHIDALAPRFLLRIAGVAIITAGVVLLRRRWPAGLAAWLLYAIIVGPVVGIVHSGYQLAQDRYSYLSCLPWALLVGGAFAVAVRAVVTRRIRARFAALIGVTGCAWLAALAVLGWQQVKTWHDTDTLWRFAIDSTPQCSLCENNLGTELLNRGSVLPALGHFERALAIRPDRVKIHANLGLAFGRLGDLARAEREFRTVLAEDPGDRLSLQGLGVTFMKEHRDREGLVVLRTASLLSPDDPQLLANYGTALLDGGDARAAVPVFRQALGRAPLAGDVLYGLVRAEAAVGNRDAARVELGILRTIDPERATLAAPLLLTTW